MANYCRAVTKSLRGTTSKLQEKPSALESSQNMTIHRHRFTSFDDNVLYVFLDPDPFSEVGSADFIQSGPQH
jgi:hypothetical protein